MSDLDVAGHYEIGGEGFSIENREGTLVIISSEVPPGFEPTLSWIGAATVLVSGGPIDGAEVEFVVDNGTVTGARIGGVIPLERVDHPPADIAGGGLGPPDFTANPERDRVFEEIWASVDGGTLAIPDPYPVHAFVQWLSRRGEVIFHGSGRTGIEEFRPRRESTEVANYGGHGNLGAVYGTHDGLWAMFFAIVDRDKLRGSIRNGVATYCSPAGDERDIYRFSVDYRSLEIEPFSAGALYFLPRESFERIPLYPGGPPGNEWASATPVRPLGKVLIEPSDFPFLDKVGGHDDGPLYRLSELGDEVFARVVAAERIESGYRIRFEGLDPAVREEWLTLGRQLLPDITRGAIDDATVEMTGPAAFVDAMGRRLEHLLD